MTKTELLIAAMAEQCRGLIQEGKCGEASSTPLPTQLSPTHLLLMCDKIEKNSNNWPATKLHRWIGFVQCGMMANGILDFTGARAMFDNAKKAFGPIDEDLMDHLDAGVSYKVEIGGEG